jgi:hypothetical protein
VGLNIAKGNMYDFITHTWNTVKGICPHGCSYCYMKRFKNQKPVRFERNELREFDRDCEKYGPGLFIFVGSSCDMWAEDIPDSWISDTLAKCREADLNAFLFQSKSPFRFVPWSGSIPAGSILCTTIETNRTYRAVMGVCPTPWSRAYSMAEIPDFRRFVTIEPIMDFDLEPLVELVKRCEPEQVNIGADSGGNHLVEPSRRQVLALIDELHAFTKVDLKKNLRRILG